MERTNIIELQVGESIRLNSPDSAPVVLTIEAKSGQRARIRVQADDSVRIERKTFRNRLTLPISA